jgi:hypothetical protein
VGGDINVGMGVGRGRLRWNAAKGRVALLGEIPVCRLSRANGDTLDNIAGDPKIDPGLREGVVGTAICCTGTATEVG